MNSIGANASIKSLYSLLNLYFAIFDAIKFILISF